VYNISQPDCDLARGIHSTWAAAVSWPEHARQQSNQTTLLSQQVAFLRDEEHNSTSAKHYPLSLDSITPEHPLLGSSIGAWRCRCLFAQSWQCISPCITLLSHCTDQSGRYHPWKPSHTDPVVWSIRHC
jgi:hypothetical protein